MKKRLTKFPIDAAAMTLGVQCDTIRSWAKRGLLEIVKAEGRDYVTRKSLEHLCVQSATQYLAKLGAEKGKATQ